MLQLQLKVATSSYTTEHSPELPLHHLTQNRHKNNELTLAAPCSNFKTSVVELDRLSLRPTER
jgi:hypothetical protein